MTNLQPFFTECREMVASGNVLAALQCLVQNLPDSELDARSEAILHRAKLIRIEEQERRALLTPDAINVERNRITQSVLKFLDELERRFIGTAHLSLPQKTEATLEASPTPAIGENSIRTQTNELSGPSNERSVDELRAAVKSIKDEVVTIRPLLLTQHDELLRRFGGLDAHQQATLIEMRNFMQLLTDEAKDGPRLFSLLPTEPGFLGKPSWLSQKFRLTLWCEHTHLPLPLLNKNDKQGVYELDIPREWFVKSAPFLKVLTGTLSVMLPLASAVAKLALEDSAHKEIEKQLELGKESIDAVLKTSEKVDSWIETKDPLKAEPGEAIRAQGALLRQLHFWLRAKDPGFGGLVRVQNKSREFLWVHPKFVGEYPACF